MEHVQRQGKGSKALKPRSHTAHTAYYTQSNPKDNPTEGEGTRKGLRKQKGWKTSIDGEREKTDIILQESSNNVSPSCCLFTLGDARSFPFFLRALRGPASIFESESGAKKPQRKAEELAPPAESVLSHEGGHM